MDKRRSDRVKVKTLLTNEAEEKNGDGGSLLIMNAAT
jgi:hypothetical protein